MKKHHLIIGILAIAAITGVVYLTNNYSNKPMMKMNKIQNNITMETGLYTPIPTITTAYKNDMIVENLPIKATADKPKQMNENSTSTSWQTKSSADSTAKPEKVLSRGKKDKSEPIDFGILKDKIICIDPGHQRKSNITLECIAPTSNIKKEKMAGGTSGVVTGIPEYRLNLMVSEKLKNALETHGVKVVMTRSTDTVDISNIERAKLANSIKADIVLRIHADGSESPSARGVSILYPAGKYINSKSILENSKLAASKVLDAIIASTGANSRGIVARNDLTGFNWSTRPVILVEMGFMTNKNEDKLLSSSEYQGKIVDGTVHGLAAYFNSIQ